MHINIEIAENDLKELVRKEIVRLSGVEDIKLTDIKIEVKSKQNYRAEWEVAEFRARLEKFVYPTQRGDDV